MKIKVLIAAVVLAVHTAVPALTLEWTVTPSAGTDRYGYAYDEWTHIFIKIDRGVDNALPRPGYDRNHGLKLVFDEKNIAPDTRFKFGIYTYAGEGARRGWASTGSNNVDAFDFRGTVTWAQIRDAIKKNGYIRIPFADKDAGYMTLKAVPAPPGETSLRFGSDAIRLLPNDR